jgi:hypothetical protein
MNERSIEVQSTLSPSDYQALRIYFMYKRKPGRTRILVGILLISFAFLVISQSAYSMPFFKHLGIIGIIIMATIYSLITREAKKLEPGFKNLMNKKQELSISDQGVSAKWEGFSQAYDYEWPDFEYAVEVNSHYFLFLEQYDAITISKLLLKEHEVIEIRKLIEEHIRLVSETSGWRPKRS